MENYIPKINDSVTTTLGFSGRFIVSWINRESETADLESIPASGDSIDSTYILASVAWKALRSSDLSQSPLRIVREVA
jgi:hypothetical protein